MRPYSKQFTNLDASQAQDVEIENLGVSSGFSAQVMFTGSPAGTLTLQGRNPGGQWMTVGKSGDYQVTISGITPQMFEYVDHQFGEARVHWVPSGGTGSLSVSVYAHRR